MTTNDCSWKSLGSCCKIQGPQTSASFSYKIILDILNKTFFLVSHLYSASIIQVQMEEIPNIFLMKGTDF